MMMRLFYMMGPRKSWKYPTAYDVNTNEVRIRYSRKPQFEPRLANWACCLAGYKRVYHLVHSELVHLVPEIVQIQVQIEPDFMSSENVSNLRLDLNKLHSSSWRDTPNTSGVFGCILPRKVAV